MKARTVMPWLVVALAVGGTAVCLAACSKPAVARMETRPTPHVGRLSIGDGSPAAARMETRPTWQVTDSALADVTGDGLPEWVLVVWRPWRDWPVQRWSASPSPIAGYHDAAGESCHLVLLDPGDGREIWAGSALPVPFLALAVRDVDGDGTQEVLTLEGSYAQGRDGPGTRIDVWSWHGFGWTLEGRSPPGTYHPACLDRYPRPAWDRMCPVPTAGHSRSRRFR
ncbi:MAG: hypothetical protein ISS56_13230 [Anaerolineae bacterium]|nr:hypothetical protein [Anaerolineae bacterium]